MLWVTDIQTQTDWERDWQRQTQTERQTDRHRLRERLTETDTDRETDRQTDTDWERDWQAGWFLRPDCAPSSERPRASIAARHRATGSIIISHRASCCCSSAIAAIAIGANFKIYLLCQFCSNQVSLQYTGDTVVVVCFIVAGRKSDVGKSRLRGRR